jgi:hypothetical protein
MVVSDGDPERMLDNVVSLCSETLGEPGVLSIVEGGGVWEGTGFEMELLRGMNSLGRRVGCNEMGDLTEQDVVSEVLVVAVLPDDAVSTWEELEVEPESILEMVGSINLTRWTLLMMGWVTEVWCYDAFLSLISIARFRLQSDFYKSENDRRREIGDGRGREDWFLREDLIEMEIPEGGEVGGADAECVLGECWCFDVTPDQNSLTTLLSCISISQARARGAKIDAMQADDTLDKSGNSHYVIRVL